MKSYLGSMKILLKIYQNLISEYVSKNLIASRELIHHLAISLKSSNFYNFLEYFQHFLKISKA